MAETSPANSSNQNLMAALTYLLGFITGIIFLFIEKENKFVRFHAMQSTVTFGGLFILGILLGFVPILGWIVGILLVPVEIILWIVLMYKAYTGETFKLPFFGDLAEKRLAKMK